MISHEKAREIAKKIVNQMTLEEKIKQINFRSPAIDRLDIKDYNYWNEGLHGVARAGVATVFPQAIGLAAMFDEEMMQRVAEVIATEGRAKYNQYNIENDRDIYKCLTYWSPNVNIFRDPRWGRGQETYGEDPYLTSRLGVAFIKGLQGDGPYLKLAACAKHYAVHSGPEAGRHSFNAVVGQKDLWETYLPAFEAAVKEADVESVMGAYNAVNGIPACVNPQLIEEILRKEWKFEGHVVSDYCALEDVHENHKYTKNASETMALAMKIGCNLCAGEISHYLFDAYEQGLVTEDEITNSVVELYTTRVRLGMFDEKNEYNQIPYEVNDSKVHNELSLETAEKSMVLLKNENFLPLDKKKVNAIAVIGPNAMSVEALQGNYFGTASRYTTFVEGIQNEMGNHGRVYYAKGSHLFKAHAESSLSRPDERESEAIIAAKHADLSILCLGLDPTIEGEQGDSGNVYGSGDKPTLGLPGHQEQLLRKVLEVGKPVLVVLVSGSCLSLNGLEEHPLVKGIIQAWYPGSHGGTALANLVFGHTSPSGKLPITFYKNTDLLPPFEDYSMKERTYRYMSDEPLYPFGFGLNYGKTMVTDSKVSSEKEGWNCKITLKNEGHYDVEEVIQIYAKTNSVHEVVNSKLVAFKRIRIEAGQSVSTEIKVKIDQIKVVNEAGIRLLDGDQVIFYVGISGPDERSKALLQQEPNEHCLPLEN